MRKQGPAFRSTTLQKCYVAYTSAQAGSKDELIGARSDDYTVARRINMVSSSPFFLFR